MLGVPRILLPHAPQYLHDTTNTSIPNELSSIVTPLTFLYFFFVPFFLIYFYPPRFPSIPLDSPLALPQIHHSSVLLLQHMVPN